MGKCSVGIAFFTAHCNYTLIVSISRTASSFRGPGQSQEGAQRSVGGMWGQASRSRVLVLHQFSPEKGNTTTDNWKAGSPSSRRFSPPVTFARGTRAEHGPSNGLSNARAPPLVSPGKRSAAARRDQGRRAPRPSRGAEDAWSCARTRGAVQVWVPPDSSCGSHRFCGGLSGRSPAAAGVDAPWPRPRRRSCWVSLRSGALVPRAAVYLRSCGPFGERASKFFLKKSFCFCFFGTPNNYFQCSSA